MVRATLTSCLLGVITLSGSGCMTCCPPASPWENPFYGCVETGPLGAVRPTAADRRAMRRALRNSLGNGQCPNCYGGFDSGYDDMSGVSMGMMPDSYGMHDAGACPTCQQQMPMNMPMEGYPMMNSSPGMPGMEVQPHQINVPTPTPTPMSPTPMSPTPAMPGGPPMPGTTPGPMATPDSTSQFYPTGSSPLLNGSAAAMPVYGQPGTSYGQMSQRPPQIRPFYSGSRVQAVSSPSTVVASPATMQPSLSMEQYPVQPQGAMTSAEMVYIPSQQPVLAPSMRGTAPQVQQTLYAP